MGRGQERSFFLYAVYIFKVYFIDYAITVVPEAPYTILIFLDYFFLLVVLNGCFLLPDVPNH